MARLVVIYHTPKDGAAFDRYYMAVHVPIAKKIPGLRRYEISKGGVGTPAGPAPIHLVATLHFDTVADIQSAFGSPEGQAAAADLANFADGGADMLIFETADV